MPDRIVHQVPHQPDHDAEGDEEPAGGDDPARLRSAGCLHRERPGAILDSRQARLQLHTRFLSPHASVPGRSWGVHVRDHRHSDRPSGRPLARDNLPRIRVVGNELEDPPSLDRGLSFPDRHVRARVCARRGAGNARSCGQPALHPGGLDRLFEDDAAEGALRPSQTWPAGSRPLAPRRRIDHLVAEIPGLPSLPGARRVDLEIEMGTRERARSGSSTQNRRANSRACWS